MQAPLKNNISDPLKPDTDNRHEILALHMARIHTIEVSSHPAKSDLLKSLDIWEQVLNKANAIFKTIPSNDLPVSRAGEWMLDNFYVVKQTFRQITENLPTSFLNQLPIMSGTSLQGQLRIFALAWEWIGYSHSLLDLTQITGFVQDFQQITPLTIGELWALPSMLRIGIIERLVYAAAELTGIEVPRGLSEISDQYASPNLSNEDVVANCFLSLRLLSTTDWEDFFEQTSRVEQILRNDPAGVYSSMDFATRNNYRSVIEELARHSNSKEEQIALAAIEFARNVDDKNPGRKGHVGFYLLDAGRATLEKSIRYKPELSIRIWRALLAFPAITYLGSIALFSILFLLALLVYAKLSGGSLLQIILVGLLGLGLAVEAAISLVQRNVTHRIKPQSLPRMDFSDGIPPGYGAIVVIPCLMENTDELNHLLQGLELYYLANPDKQLTFALLTDLVDAPVRDTPKDEQLLSLARAGIENLNKKYASQATPFYLFHRQRQWNPSEGVWMGWERKRGKLADFNRLMLNLRPDSPDALRETAYTTQVGDVSMLADVKYVITLDADTSLPKGSAKRLIATLAHPLNQAEFASDGCSVIAGYTVLQPRVDIKPTSANRSLFSQIFAMNSGFDLYSFAVSDVYQDLFGEGSYVGKGIYDIAAFECSLAGQVRQNTLLSHDLFEGIYGRSALVTDILLYEEYPSRYLVYAHRLRRWIRGDWQLLPWLFSTVYTETGRAANRLSVIDRWKIFDNLRRSLVQANLVAILVAGWLCLPGSPLVWTLLVLLPYALPIAMQVVHVKKHNLEWLSLKRFLKPIELPLKRMALYFIFLPYEATLALSAIGVTIARMFIFHKHMLQWTTAARAARSLRLNSHYGTWAEMGVSSLLAVLLGLTIAIFNPTALHVALPMLIAWLLAPQIAYQISQPITHISTTLTKTQHRQVLRLARRTWAYFEQFAGPNDHWLPPDHFQESPRGSVAHYTTPTNIGLFLVSTLSAYDLGYIGLLELEIRLRSTFESMGKMEHYRGHLLNWYNSQTLVALPPHYVSTVDSGNLAACLITVKQGCLALAEAQLLDDKRWQGLLVLLDILTEVLQVLEKNNPHVSIESLEVELTCIYERISAVQNKPSDWQFTLDWLSGEGWERVSHRLLDLLENHPHLQEESLDELNLYLDLMYHHIQDMQHNLDLFAPWLKRLDAPTELLMQTPAWKDFRNTLLAEKPTLEQATDTYERIKKTLENFKIQLLDNDIPDPARNDTARDWCQNLENDLSSAHLKISPLLKGFQELASQADSIINAMDFRFLFNEHRQLFHIGYTPSSERLDPSYYDLLASESRIASIIAIAKGDVPQSHWRHLGRPVTEVNGKQVLLSWSGTMFEYLMPTLFSKNYTRTFLLDSCYTALDVQESYGQEKQVPWGISESGYYAFDLDQNYQYRAFGVPSLGYKREMSVDLVIAPYASLLGLSMQPQAVLKNMAHLEKLNMLGRFGFYEAVDYTKTRLPEKHKDDIRDGQAYSIVKSYMAHHQGMILTAVCNFLLKDVMVERFHSDEHIQSVELLLQEKIPQNPPLEFPHKDEPVEFDEVVNWVNSSPWHVQVDSPIPQVHVLSQGETSLLITNAGSGYSQWCEFALTRWHADSTLDQWGTWIYIQDRDNGALWSATCQPIGCALEHLDVLFYPHKVEFQRTDNGISLRTEVTISTDGVEIRRVNILNDSDHPRKLKLTSYGEVVLASQEADRRHPAFNKLFIESEYLPKENALLFKRRPRSADEKPVVLVHSLIFEVDHKVTCGFESDRAKFLGRSHTMLDPLALQDPDQQIVGGTGGTLDPILSLSQEIDLKPHAKTRIIFLTLAAATRAEALEKLSRYQSGQSIHRAFEDCRISSERELLELGLNTSSLEHIQRLYSALLHPTGALRASPHILAQNEKGQSDLWAFGISGDYPIMLVRISDGESSLLMEALRAFSYWRNHHITVNLVILNDQDTGYALDLHNTIQRQITKMGVEAWINQREGIFIQRTDQLQPSDLILFETVAGVILDEKSGLLADHTRRLTAQLPYLPAFTPSISGRTLVSERGPAIDPEPTLSLPIPSDLLMENGLGGFSQDGKEYIIHLKPGQQTPHPWVNIVANPQFGFLVSEAGSGCTWAENSGENRLTPWRNDPVTDMPGEALYLRDEESGLVWSPTPMPAGAETTHIIHHGAGYSIFESQSHGLNQNLRLYVAPEAPVKIAQMKLKNLWNRPRRITVTYYAEWVLGTDRDTNQAYIIPEFDPDKKTLLASNHFNSEFAERVAFLAASKKPHGVTTDRSEFLGRMGSLHAPAALGRIGLASAVNAGLDPCAAIQLHVDLAPGASEEVFFLIGEGANKAESLALIEQVQKQGGVELIWEAVNQQWEDILGTVTVHTPDPGLDLMLNRWLLYQTLACRMWGRTALYQSSGAFGFRDQLQDVLALLQTRPDLARAHILEAARHQFEAGDVLHWWNPPLGRGVRTRFSDDLLWLPFVTAEYVTTTGDASILKERLPFLNGEALKPDEMERYKQFEATEETFSLYQHCRRALEKGSTSGAHGLPLMASGDWNDGMNRVGVEGHGESIWLGWFLHATLTRFVPLVALMKDDPTPLLEQAKELSSALNAHAWDGDWYLRAFYDDGTKLGSHENDECQIDSIAQSWAVLSGAADPAHMAQAMASVRQWLIKTEDQMVLLFTPPFDKTEHDPGYIKGYPPGVRENGGQYTHAATWTAWAFAKLGQGDQATELFHMLNPINHADTAAKIAKYKVEPYIIAADIYSEPAHIGKGGWTWYTGTAGWMYRLGLEAILGITRSDQVLNINPCIPREWPGYEANYRFGTTYYTIRVENPQGVNQGIQKLLMDGKVLTGNQIPLTDDGRQHDVLVFLGKIGIE